MNTQTICILFSILLVPVNLLCTHWMTQEAVHLTGMTNMEFKEATSGISASSVRRKRNWWYYVHFFNEYSANPEKSICFMRMHVAGGPPQRGGHVPLGPGVCQPGPGVLRHDRQLHPACRQPGSGRRGRALQAGPSPGPRCGGEASGKAPGGAGIQPGAPGKNGGSRRRAGGRPSGGPVYLWKRRGLRADGDARTRCILRRFCRKRGTKRRTYP